VNPLCPHAEPFWVAGEAFSAQEIQDLLGPYLSDERHARIRDVIAQRTYSIVPVTEGLYDRGNVSAVMRSAEAMGCQPLHMIDTSKAFKEAKRVTQGADKWLDIRIWKDTASCVEFLRRHGYRIVVTHVRKAKPIAEVRFDVPTAIFFGNEKTGTSEELLEAANDRVMVPMQGFTRSFNISVAAALCLYHIQQDRLRRLGRHGDLDEETRHLLTASFYLRGVPNAEEILLEMRTKRGASPDGKAKNNA